MRRTCLSSGDILRHVQSAIDDAQCFFDFCLELEKEGKREREAIRHVKNIAERISPMVRQVWSDTASLTLQGSRAKNTHLAESDFDYHIEGVGRPLTYDDMFALKLCIDRGISDVFTHPVIKLALVVMSSKPPVVMELVPERCDYVEDAILTTIEKATSYFWENPAACNVVRYLKYMFLRTGPRLKNCFIESMVQELPDELLGNGLPHQEPGRSHCLFLHALGLVKDSARRDEPRTAEE